MTRRKDGKRPRARRPNLLSGAVDELLGNLGLPAIRALVRLSQGWESLCGALLAQKTAPADLRGGVLTVLVCNHSWAQELQFSKPLLLERIRGMLGEGVVADIRFSVGPLPEAAPEETDTPSGRRPPSTIPLPEPDGLSEIDDPELRATLLSIQRRAFDLAHR